MPMGINEFLNAPESESGPKLRDRILEILRENPDSAFSSKELAAMLGKKNQAINPVTKKMADEGLVERKKINGLVYVALKE